MGFNFVGVSDIARDFGVTRDAVQKWIAAARDSNDPFPQPTAELSGRPAFSKREVREWVLRHDGIARWWKRAEGLPYRDHAGRMVTGGRDKGRQ